MLADKSLAWFSFERLHPAGDSDAEQQKECLELRGSYGRMGGRIAALKGIETPQEAKHCQLQYEMFKPP